VHVIPTIKKYRKILIFAAGLSFILLSTIIIGCYYTIEPYKKFAVTPESAKHTNVGLVLGAGINKQGKPYNELKARLDSAADALQKETVDHLLLSGDNRYEHYDEPTAMKNYLIEARGIAPEKLTADFAGRSTFESCERAAKVFGLRDVLVFSAGSHLPRAIYLCRHFGIETHGIASGLEANNSSRREPLARVKAIYNTLVKGEHTVLGDHISLP
jgi:vancomycin permeability regulator SanA